MCLSSTVCIILSVMADNSSMMLRLKVATDKLVLDCTGLLLLATGTGFGRCSSLTLLMTHDVHLHVFSQMSQQLCGTSQSMAFSPATENGAINIFLLHVLVCWPYAIISSSAEGCYCLVAILSTTANFLNVQLLERTTSWTYIAMVLGRPQWNTLYTLGHTQCI